MLCCKRIPGIFNKGGEKFPYFSQTYSALFYSGVFPHVRKKNCVKPSNI